MADKNIPEEFTKVIRDFVGDLITTFPEYVPLINKWWKPDETIDSVKLLFEFCSKKLPPRFFDILYQNEDIFKEDSVFDTEFLPNIHFKNIWQSEISDKTKATIWKYLQLMIFSIVGTLDNKESFGDTAKLFESINEDEFKTKLQDTISQIQGLFDTNPDLDTRDPDTPSPPSPSPSPSPFSSMPDADKINDHISGMLDGKLGQMAREIAEETASNLNMDLDGATDMKDVLSSLMKNPTKLTGLIKTVGDKLDSKFKSGELNETEMLKEAAEMMSKMKNMPGMENIQSMLNKMGMGSAMGNMGGLGKVNTAAMETQLNQRLKLATTKDRIRAKAESNANSKAKLEADALKQMNLITSQNQTPINKILTDEELIKIFGAGEKDSVERTPRGTKPPINSSGKKGKGKGKGK
jgi:hypothetical protein